MRVGRNWRVALSMVSVLLLALAAMIYGAYRRDLAAALQMLGNVLPIREREKGSENDLMIDLAPPRYDLERIRTPTLLISAQDDLVGTFRMARYTAEHIPGAQFVGFPIGGHLLLGHWKEVEAVEAGFLSRHSSEGQSKSSPQSR